MKGSGGRPPRAGVGGPEEWASPRGVICQLIDRRVGAKLARIQPLPVPAATGSVTNHLVLESITGEEESRVPGTRIAAGDGARDAKAAPFRQGFAPR